MASETGGIALLSMYNDEEEELTEAPPSASAEVASEPVCEAADDVNRYEDAEGRDKDTTPEPAFGSTTTLPFGSRSTPHSDEGVDYDEALKSSTPLPLPPMRSSSPFTLFFPTMRHPSSDPLDSLDPPGTRRPAFSIVDYGHDDTAMSPEPKEEAILVNDGVTVSAEVQVFEVKLDERTPPGTVQILTSDAQQEPLKSSELSELPKSDTSSPMNFTGNEAEVSQVDETIVVSVEIHKADPLISFLHLPLLAKCPDGLQEKINKFIAYKRAGKSFNADLRNRKDYRNPDFLQHAVRYQEIDEIGSCFSKDVFDPHGYDKSDYYDEIENEMRREIERKDLKRKKSREMEFVSGGTSVISTSKFRQNPVASMSIAVNTALSTTSTAGDAVGKDARQNKKTKWDKNAVSGGQNNVPTIDLHSSILSAANAGSGYTVFAEQKRTEAKEKRTSDRRFEKQQ